MLDLVQEDRMTIVRNRVYDSVTSFWSMLPPTLRVYRITHRRGLVRGAFDDVLSQEASVESANALNARMREETSLSLTSESCRSSNEH